MSEIEQIKDFPNPDLLFKTKMCTDVLSYVNLTYPALQQSTLSMNFEILLAQGELQPLG